MGRKKNIFVQVWDFLLDMGIAKAALLLNAIFAFSAIVVLAVLRWIVQHTK